MKEVVQDHALEVLHTLRHSGINPFVAARVLQVFADAQRRIVDAGGAGTRSR
jgi:hypothetical protein